MSWLASKLNMETELNLSRKDASKEMDTSTKMAGASISGTTFGIRVETSKEFRQPLTCSTLSILIPPRTTSFHHLHVISTISATTRSGRNWNGAEKCMSARSL